jgi:hypothetical protein
MSKRLNDTAALKSQGIKAAGNEFASCKSNYLPNSPNQLEPATDSADYAVESERRQKEFEERMYSPEPYVAPSERAEYRRKTGAGNSSLSNAVKVARGE